MTGALSSVALDEWRGAEILQTGAGRGERLAATVSTSSGVLELKILIDIGKLKSWAIHYRRHSITRKAGNLKIQRI